MEYTPGNIVHIEIPAPDIARLKQFYGGVMGWTFQPLHDGYMFFDAGNIAGALVAHMEPSEKGTVVTVMADNVAGKLKEAEKAGGRILQDPIEITGVGTYGYFADPCGNKIGAWMRATSESPVN